MKYLFLITVMAFLTGGCSPSKVANSTAKQQVTTIASTSMNDTLLFGKTWSIVKLEGKDRSIVVPSDVVATLIFDAKTSRVYGSCCNRYFGEYSIRGNKVTFDKVGSTKMFCMGIIGDIENLYHSMLASEQTVQVDDSMLVLTSDRGIITFTASKDTK